MKTEPSAIEAALSSTQCHLSPITAVHKLTCIMNIPCLPLQSIAWHKPHRIHSMVFHGADFKKWSVLFCSKPTKNGKVLILVPLSYCMLITRRGLGRLSSGVAVKLLLIICYCLVLSLWGIVLFLVLLSGWQVRSSGTTQFLLRL